MKMPLSKLLKKLNDPTPQDYGINIRKDNPASVKEATVVINGPGRKQFTADARERVLPSPYAKTMSMYEFPGRRLFQDPIS